MSKSFLEESEKIIAAASAGPWRLRDYIGVHVVGPSGHGPMLAVFDRNMDVGAGSPTGWEGRIEDARFMAQARNKWPDHLAALQRIRKLVDLEDKQAATELIRNILEELE